MTRHRVRSALDRVCLMDLTPVPDRSACPNNANHTPAPGGYIAWHEWAEKMVLTHVQHRCPDCGLFKLWMPKEGETIHAG